LTRRVEAREWVMEQIESERRNFEAKLAEVEKRCKTVPAKLPIAKTWRQESVTYEGEVVAYGGSAYQAARTGLASRAPATMGDHQRRDRIAWTVR
jgi:hypothetical protein